MKRKRTANDEDLLVLKMRRIGTSSWLTIKPPRNPIDLHHASANHPHAASPASANLTEAAPQDPPPVLRLRRTDSSNWSVLEKVCKVEMIFLTMLNLEKNW